MTKNTVTRFPAEFADGEKFVLPSGKYLIGDPCYTLGSADDELWDSFIDEETPESNLAATINGKLVVAMSTAYGDGVYGDQNGNSYGVDAGLIGAVPMSLLEELEVDIADWAGTKILVPEGEDLVVFSEEGILFFVYGEKLVSINTSGDDE